MGEQIPAESMDYVKSVIIPALSLQQDILRRTATQVIAMMMAILQPINWLDGLSRLMQLVDSSNVDEAEVSDISLTHCKQRKCLYLIRIIELFSGRFQHIC